MYLCDGLCVCLCVCVCVCVCLSVCVCVCVCVYNFMVCSKCMHWSPNTNTTVYILYIRTYIPVMCVLCHFTIIGFD